VGLGEGWQAEQHRKTNSKHDEIAGDGKRAHLHSALRKKRPVMPCGSRRSSTTAATSKATSPSTEVKAKVASVLTAPSSAEAMAVRDRIAAPPLITVMNALAM